MERASTTRALTHGVNLWAWYTVSSPTAYHSVR